MILELLPFASQRHEGRLAMKSGSSSREHTCSLIAQAAGKLCSAASVMIPDAHGLWVLMRCLGSPSSQRSQTRPDLPPQRYLLPESGVSGRGLVLPRGIGKRSLPLGCLQADGTHMLAAPKRTVCSD